MAEEMSIDERVFRAHVSGGPFQSGVDRGKWRLIEIDWPFVIIAITAAKRANAPEEFFFRFELTNYPQDPPTADLWDIEREIKLEASRRPRGKLRVSLAFRADRNSLYLPCDRLEIQGHQGWRNQHPSMLWSPDRDITQYTRIIYELLNSLDYSGVSST